MSFFSNSVECLKRATQLLLSQTCDSPFDQQGPPKLVAKGESSFMITEGEANANANANAKAVLMES